MKKILVFLKQFSSVFIGTPRSAAISWAFVIAIILLLAVIYNQMKSADRIAHPAGLETIQEPRSLKKESPKPGDVLILNSYHMGYSWSDNEMEGIMETLRKWAPEIQPRIEYLDCKHFPKMEHFPKIRDLFREKYRGIRFPVVMVGDNPALVFALRYREELFPEAPIVFCGINGFHMKLVEGHKNITGVAELLDADGTVETALKLHPDVKEVVIIHDYTLTGLSTKRETEAQLKSLAGRVRFRYAENMSMEDLSRYLKNLPGNSIVLALSYSLDKEGNVVNHEAISRFLSTHSPVPVYGLHEERIGYGIVGGSLLGGKYHAQRSALMALRILAGENISFLPIDLKSPTQNMFDYNQLKRFGIGIDRLPRDSIIVNRPVPFISSHFYLVITTLLIMMILVSGIVILGFTMYRKSIAESTIIMQVKELEAKNAELERFTYTVSHDLKSPIITIRGFLGTLVQDARAGRFDRMESDIMRISRATDKMQSLLEDLLELSRIGRIVNPPAEFCMADAAREAGELLHATLLGKGVKLNIDPSMPRIWADRQRMTEVLQNLIENGAKYMGDQKNPMIQVGCLPGEECDTYFVRDNGMGIDKKFHTKIFGLFDKLDAGSSGTGIGLALVKRIVELHAGRIWVESEGAGKGSVFFFTLPRMMESKEN